MSSAAFYRIACKEVNDLVKPLGFKRDQRFFYRITEDGVVQQFCLLWLYRRFTIRFRLSSVYSDNIRRCEGAEIYQIIDKSNKWLSKMCPPNIFYELTDATYELATLVCKHAIVNALLPYFDRTEHAENARKCMIEHDSLVSKRGKGYDMREIGFYIGLDDYENAKKVLEYFIDNQDRWNERCGRESKMNI